MAGIAASLIFTGAPAMAQDDEVVVQGPRDLGDDYDRRIKRVSYHDLNLATRAGEQILERRVGLAVREVCLNAEKRRHGLTPSDHYRCTVGAWQGTWPQMTQAIARARQMAYNRR